jgi:hypothetical protein
LGCRKLDDDDAVEYFTTLFNISFLFIEMVMDETQDAWSICMTLLLQFLITSLSISVKGTCLITSTSCLVSLTIIFRFMATSKWYSWGDILKNILVITTFWCDSYFENPSIYWSYPHYKNYVCRLLEYVYVHHQTSFFYLWTHSYALSRHFR